MPSIQVQAENKILSIVQQMQLDWPPANQMRCQRLPWNVQGDGNVVMHPGLAIYPLKPAYAAGTNEREDVGYGVGLAFICPAEHFTSEMRDKVSIAREKVRRKLVEDRLTLDLISGAIYNQTKVSDTEVNLPKELHRYEVSGLAVRCWVREPRT